MIYKAFFESLDKVKYRIMIIKKGEEGSTESKELLLSGDQPVVVAYNTAERLLDPLRTSTCTISLLTEDYPMGIFSGAADGTSIQLYKNDVLEWTGYLQPNIYNQGYSDIIERLELVASDPISTLQYFDYETIGTKMGIVSFKEILDMIVGKFSSLKGYSVGKIGTSVDREIEIADLYISEGNFFSKEDEPWNLQDVLKEMCQFLGMTAIVEGDMLYIIDYYNMNTQEQVIDYFKDGTTGTRTVGQNRAITAESYKQTGADMSLDDVFNKVSARDSQYNIANLLPDLNDKSQLTNLNGAWEETQIRECYTKPVHGGYESVGTGYYRFWEHKHWTQHHYSADFPSGAQPIDIPLTGRERGDATNIRNYCMASLMDFAFTPKKRGLKPKIDFKKYLTLCTHNRPHTFPIGSKDPKPGKEENHFPMADTDYIAPIIYGGDAWVVLNYTIAKTFFIRQPFIVDDDSIPKNITGGGVPFLYEGYPLVSVDFIPKMNFELRVNNKWWNGKEWQAGRTHFTVTSENLDFENFFQTEVNVINNISGDFFTGKAGYKIQLPQKENAIDDIYFAIDNPEPAVYCMNEDYGADDSSGLGPGGNAYTWISNIGLEIVKQGQQLWSNDDIVYENVIDKDNAIEGPELTFRMTSENDKSFSYSTVGLNEAGINPIGEVRKRRLRKAQCFEKNVIEEYVNQYSTPSIRENVCLDMSFGQFDKIRDNYWNKDFQVMGVEKDYQYDRQTISLIEKK